ncbi:chromosome segregation protein SMC [Candidatus Nitronereus thalassa]|uniref:Chromosome partition protein Smc n=1 Tax=Candidatus Nitronereus thalassa TaxID=3020898 RepID=A0ABU3K825_9BACT|nr:chromosome segregation protein SMC [Candidatus Nitronereus thalassa]MDT7042567.1 chromosome segregation protein SMC [Candidatus Nitronereus thalassa]
MQLKSMIVSGFKSFHEAKIDFPKGITAIVGPNGAGKSNVVDSILWVLGEQSTKALRSEKMEDVIFNGTESRKPLGMAEVSLIVTDVTSQELESVAGVFDELPGNKEIMVTRRLYRDGDSEYYINKIPCRLKDVRSLFLEARAGTKGHTVIEQGNIDQILSGSPQDRRNFIEETAGIGRFKKQKNEALRKLNSTEQNLVRVRDVIGEVQKQLRTLERQARQAEQYGKLQEECRALELNVLRWDYQELGRDRADFENQISALEAQEAEHMAEEATVTATHEQLKEEQLRDGEVVGKTQEELRKLEHEMGQTLTVLEVERHRIQLYTEQQAQGVEEQDRLGRESANAVGAIDSLQQQLTQAREDAQQAEQTLARLEAEEQALVDTRSSLQAQAESLRKQILEGTVERTQSETRLQNLDARQEDLSREIRQLQEDQSLGETDLTDIRDKLVDAREKLGQLTTQVQSTRAHREEILLQLSQLDQQIRDVEQQRVNGKTEQAAAESRLAALQAVLQEEFGYEGGAESSSIRQTYQGVKEAVGECLDVPQQIEQAVEAALGEHIRAWVVDGESDILQALQFMKEHDLGRGTFIPSQPYDITQGQVPDWWSELQLQEGVMGRAAEMVGVPEELKAVVHSLLQRVVVIQNLDQALALVRQRRWVGPTAPLFATLSGEIVETSGLVSGGSTGDSSGVLQRRREVRTLESHIADIGQRLEATERRHKELRQEHEAAKEQLRTLDELLKESERNVLMAENEVSNFEQQIADVEEQVQSVTQELASNQAGLVRLKEQSQTCRDRLGQLAQEQTTQQSDLDRLVAQLQEVEAETSRLYEQLTGARLTRTTLHERRERTQADSDRIQQEEEARQSRIRLLAEKVQTLEIKAQESQAEQNRAEILFKNLEQQKDTLRGELQTLEERHHAGMSRVREFEQRLADIRKQFTSTRDKRAALEVQLAEVRTRWQTVVDTLTGTYGQSVEDLSEPISFSEDSDGSEHTAEGPTAWRERVGTIRGRLERMGPINLAAIEEHRELEERFQFLTKQEADLSESIQSLQEIIDRLSQTTNQMFEETFKAVQEKFGEVFSALFAGGHAELVLALPESEEDGEGNYLDAGVDIVAQPPGKRLKNLSMLSGGEKALTVLALLFASFLIKPSPFCILDEVDAPLDEPNVIRFARFLTQLTDLSQFLVITHNKRTMEIADSLFGVTMEEPGVSKFVSVRIGDLQNA